MYAHNTFAKRRRDGWAERQYYFRRLTEQTRAKAGETDKNQKANADKGAD